MMSPRRVWHANRAMTSGESGEFSERTHCTQSTFTGTWKIVNTVHLDRVSPVLPFEICTSHWFPPLRLKLRSRFSNVSRIYICITTEILILSQNSMTLIHLNPGNKKYKCSRQRPEKLTVKSLNTMGKNSCENEQTLDQGRKEL